MSETVTFIHAADLHLGAPFRGLRNVSDKWADRLVKAVPEAYDRLVDVALEHHVDFVIIAGDTFDEAHPSYGDYLHFINGLNRLGQAGIPVYLCTGNHDPYTSWRQNYARLPQNAFMFSATRPGYFCYQRDGRPIALLAGRGFYNQAWPAGESVATGITAVDAEAALGVSAPFSIGVIHTGLDRDISKAPVAPAQLQRAGMDYWALGHLHRPEIIDDPNDPHIVFSGCIQGRALNETGPHGVNLVTLRKGACNKVEFIPTASVAWERPNVDVSDAESLSDVVERIVSELYRLNGTSFCSQMIERIVLRGATTIHETLQRPGVLDDLRDRINAEVPDFFCDAVVDATTLPLDKERMRREGLFPATFMETCGQTVKHREEALAYLQDAFAEKGLSLPRFVEKRLDTLGSEAEDLVLDLLNGGRS